MPTGTNDIAEAEERSRADLWPVDGRLMAGGSLRSASVLRRLESVLHLQNPNPQRRRTSNG